INGLGGTDIDNHKEFQNSTALGGLALEFYRRIARHYGRIDEFDQKLKSGIKDPTVWKFEPHVAEKVINDWLGEYPVSVLRNKRLKEGSDAVKKKGTVVEQIRTEDGSVYSAAMFIDATL